MPRNPWIGRTALALLVMDKFYEGNVYNWDDTGLPRLPLPGQPTHRHHTFSDRDTIRVRDEHGTRSVREAHHSAGNRPRKKMESAVDPSRSRRVATVAGGVYAVRQSPRESRRRDFQSRLCFLECQSQLPSLIDKISTRESFQHAGRINERC